MGYKESEELAVQRDERERAVLAELYHGTRASVGCEREMLAAAVRVSLRELARLFPGKSVEVRVPPFGAIQCLEGAAHTRGLPPHRVEADAHTWIALINGRSDWESAAAAGSLTASSPKSHIASEIAILGKHLRAEYRLCHAAPQSAPPTTESEHHV